MVSKKIHQATSIIKKTADGSDTLISQQFDQPYHSLNGAVAESRYVYFEASGLVDSLSSGEDLSILEIGFGTGMNLVLLLDYLKKANSHSTINFYSVEAYPIDPETAVSVNFGNEVANAGYDEILAKIFSDLNPNWNNIEISDQVTLHLFVGRFNEMNFKLTGSEHESPSEKGSDILIRHPFSYILHDPFSPESNPDGWTPGLFSKISASASENAVLTTYSAASSARAAMAIAGWNIARAPGALGKREMTVASKNPDKLSHLKRVDEKRLIERFKNGDFD